MGPDPPEAPPLIATVPLTAATTLGDPYEVDDFDPAPIVLGQPQRHTFYPIHDVDRVTFLAKQGRHYRITTTNLDPGVDTDLYVEAGGRTYANDDAKVGVLSSEVVVAMRSADEEVVVRITNRGLFGVDLGYTITVDEILPTPVPTATPTPEPTERPPAQPAPPLPQSPSQEQPQAPSVPDQPAPPTSTATPLPTATPDARDAYEPDDMMPWPIAIDEVQLHTFFPDLDGDRLIFLAKSGRRYRVSTSALAMGVDTVLSVTVGDKTYTNDDRDWGDLASEVTFEQTLPYDVIAEIAVANRGQYGPTASYRIMLQVLPPLPTATPTVSPTPTSTPTVTATATVVATNTLEARSPVPLAHSASRLPGLSKLRLTLPHQPLRTNWGPDAVSFVILLELEGPGP